MKWIGEFQRPMEIQRGDPRKLRSIVEDLMMMMIMLGSTIRAQPKLQRRAFNLWINFNYYFWFLLSSLDMPYRSQFMLFSYKNSAIKINSFM